jgi:tryptophan synthase alpha chain
VTTLLEHLRGRGEGGRKLLVPYVTAGIPEPSGFDMVLDTVSANADAVEVGLPYSDPLMDGPVIASASARVLRAGVGPVEALELARRSEPATPRLAMTYYNPIFATGEAEFCRRAVKVGIAGLIVPDLPVEESASLRQAAAEEGLAWVGLVAPTSDPRRVEHIAQTTTGFVYAVSTLGVTGVRDRLAESAGAVVDRCREATDLPVLVGIGVSTAEQALEATARADGVVVGSAVVRLVLELGAGAAGSLLTDIRSALDSRTP